MKSVLASALLVLALASGAFAADAGGDPAKRALIAEIVAAQSIGADALRSLVRESVSPFREAIIDAELDVLGAEHRAGGQWSDDDPGRRRARLLVAARVEPVFADFEAGLVAELGGGGSPDEAALRSWENVFSAGELGQIRDFEVSPLGRKTTLMGYRGVAMFSFVPVLTMFDGTPMEKALTARLKPALAAAQGKYVLSPEEEARFNQWLQEPVSGKVQQASSHLLAGGHGGSQGAAAESGKARFARVRAELGAALEAAKADVVPLLASAAR